MTRSRFLALPLACISAGFLSSCQSGDTRHRIVVSAWQQRMAVYEDGKLLSVFKVSTGKNGLGDQEGSNRTPAGKMRVADKIGAGAPLGMSFHSRIPSGEIVMPNAPGRDPIVTRILWLQGMEPQNVNAYNRFIYIHGTPVEAQLGRPASYGCVRMASVDIAWLFDVVGIGTRVDVLPGPLPPMGQLPL
jgi:lipoprotein-anchoring transpeptidase ErfK/SrfK